MPASQQYTATVIGEGGRVYVPVPLDPDALWGDKPRHHIAGRVNGMRVRGVIEPVGSGLGFVLGPAWRRDCGVEPGDEVTVVLEAEGPQRAELAPDLAAALDADPAAGEFFDALAQFYRKAYLSWIDATKRRPDQRPVRIAEVVALLAAGEKERPKR